MSDKYTWQEAKEAQRKKLGRQPTEEEIEWYYNYMSMD